MELFDTFIAHTYTHADCVRRLEFVREFLEQSFFVSPGVQEPLDAALEKFFQFRPAAAEDRAALVSYGEEFFSRFTPKNLYALLEELQKKADALPAVTLSVPVSLGGADNERLGAWFRSNLDPAAIARTRIDPEVIGGCGVGWKGAYYHLAPVFSSSEKRAEIVSLIASYAH